MKRQFKMLPTIMTILSALYLFYVYISKDTILNADAVGGDPGGKVIPYFMGIFMFIGFLYLTITEKPDGVNADKDDRNLFIFTVASVILYIALHQIFGFIICSAALVYILTYIYTTIGEKRNYKNAGAGFFITEATTAIVYLIVRFITLTLLKNGRTGVIPEIFGKTTVASSIALAAFFVIALILFLTVCKKLKATKYSRIVSAGFLSFALVLFLFIVFKQYFGVNLALGLLNY